MSVTLKSDLVKIAKHAADGVSGVNQRSARQIASTASSRAPRGATGQLAGGIEAEHAEGDDWGVAIKAWYWFLVENGTAKSGARPFLTPAVEAERENHRRAIARLFS